MSNPGLLEQAHDIIRQHLHTGDTAIDATAGNGHDTLFLAQQVGTQGKVYAFDIQQQALDNCYQRLAEQGAERQVSLIHAGHETVMFNTPEEYHLHGIQAAMFNLGYLPGSDKTRTTQISTSLSALQAIVQMLKPGGVITIMAYRGHPGGLQESIAVVHWMQQLNQDCYQTSIIDAQHNSESSPQLLVVHALVKNPWPTD